MANKSVIVTKLGLSVGVIFLVTVCTVCIGWIKNIAQIISYESVDGVSGEIILRVIGVFIPPIGAVMGFL